MHRTRCWRMALSVVYSGVWCPVSPFHWILRAFVLCDSDKSFKQIRSYLLYTTFYNFKIQLRSQNAHTSLIKWSYYELWYKICLLGKFSWNSIKKRNDFQFQIFSFYSRKKKTEIIHSNGSRWKLNICIWNVFDSMHIVNSHSYAVNWKNEMFGNDNEPK